MKKISMIILTIMCVIFSLNAQTPGYRIANKFHIDGDEGWDALCVDDVTGRIYISHGSVVQVVDESNGTVVATISGLNGVHGIALAWDLNKGFISSGRDSSVYVFDMKTYATLDKINSTGRNPDAILYDPFTHRVFAFNGGSNNATVIDATNDAVLGTIALDGKPEFGVADYKGKVFINIEDKSELSRIDAVNMIVENTWTLSPGEEPSGIAMDDKNNILFSACSNKTLVVMDAGNGKVITTVPTGERVDGADFDPATKRVFIPSGMGTLTVIREDSKDKFSVLENVDTQKGARTIALDKKTHHIFMPTADFDDPPPPTTDNPHPRPKLKPGTFIILDVEPVK